MFSRDHSQNKTGSTTNSQASQQKAIDLQAERFATYLYGPNNSVNTNSHNWQTAFQLFCQVSLELQKELITIAEAFKATDSKNTIIPAWFDSFKKYLDPLINKEVFTNNNVTAADKSYEQHYKDFCEKSKEWKKNLDAELEKIRITNKILIEINGYLDTRKPTGIKEANAKIAKDHVWGLLTSPTISHEVFVSLFNALNAWEESDKALVKNYRIPEWNNSTVKTIQLCKEILAPYYSATPLPNPTTTSSNNNDNNNNNLATNHNSTSQPSLVLAFDKSKMSIEEQLFLLMENQNFLAFDKLIKENSGKFDVNAKDKNHRTLLSHAAANSNVEFLKLLLKEGADPNIADDKYEWTPVHWIAYAGRDKHMTALINNTQKPINWEKQTAANQNVIELAKQGINNNDLPPGQQGEIIEIVQKEIEKQVPISDKQNLNQKNE